MSRVARALGVGAAVAVLVLAPWAGAQRARNTPSYFVDDDVPLFTPPPVAPALAQAVAAPFVADPQPSGGCGCDTVVVDATNDVRDTSVRTGNAKAVNNAVTYISGGYAAKYTHEIEVKVRQVARAISGDAIVGQTIALATRGPRCHNILVRARNVVQDVDVRTGNATAVNHSTILLDPGIDAKKLDIKLRQHAHAIAGTANAGQVIGVADSGGTNGCGSVKVDASNFVDDVDIRTGKAVGTNDNTVQTCAEVGCADELRALAPTADQVQMCTTDGCDKQTGAETLAALPPAPSVSPTPDATTVGTSTVVPDATQCPRYGRRAKLCQAAAAAAAAAAAESPSPAPAPTPTPTPAPSDTPAASATPTPTPSPAADPVPAV
jgi:hypothetical protein